MYNNNNYYQQNSFDYVTPNSRIVPEPPTHEYNTQNTEWKQPVRMSSLQNMNMYNRESLIDPGVHAVSSGYIRETYLEPNAAKANVEFPKSPVPNMNFFHQHEHNLAVPMTDPQIKMMAPPTPVRACVHTIGEDMTAHQAHATSNAAINESVGASFMLQPVPLNKKISTKQQQPSVASNPTRTSSIPHTNNNNNNSNNVKLPKPPLTPLVIPPTPIRTTSATISSNHSSPTTVMSITPTRTSSIQGYSSPQNLTPSSTYSPHSPLTSSPLTPGNNTQLLPPSMMPSPLTTTYNEDENSKAEAITDIVNSSSSLSSKKKSILPEGEAERHVHQGIKYHELGQLEKATEQFRLASNLDLPIGMFLYGISLRHGWGCTRNEQSAFQYLQRAAEAAVTDLNNFSNAVNLSASKGELIMAIYELGVSFRHGWGCKKNKETALYFFKIAADLGDADAQNDLAHCYHNGHGTKKDIYMAAKYYRMADKQGHGIMGNSWIWKSKYDKPSSSLS